MSKTRTQKDELLKVYENIISNGSGYILVDTSNLNTTVITDLKRQLKEIGSTFTVVKNTIVKIAFQNGKQPLPVQDFDGPTAIITIGEDPSIAAKLVKEVQIKTKLLNARAGTFNGDFLSATRVMELAELPSREVLLAKLLGSMNAPLTSVMNAFTGNARGLVMVLSGISEKKQ
ncbi:50S ribosomal protein L10 [Candidatus Dojkabacteria bacterium]|jgi:large subunit ribosomal protein L10|nr:50S ribosomal protein L10 [Candidatus Dojkabacteria bacterium]